MIAAPPRPVRAGLATVLRLRAAAPERLAGEAAAAARAGHRLLAVDLVVGAARLDLQRLGAARWGAGPGVGLVLLGPGGDGPRLRSAVIQFRLLRPPPVAVGEALADPASVPAGALLVGCDGTPEGLALASLAARALPATPLGVLLDPAYEAAR